MAFQPNAEAVWGYSRKSAKIFAFYYCQCCHLFWFWFVLREEVEEAKKEEQEKLPLGQNTYFE